MMENYWQCTVSTLYGWINKHLGIYVFLIIGVKSASQDSMLTVFIARPHLNLKH